MQVWRVTIPVVVTSCVMMGCSILAAWYVHASQQTASAQVVHAMRAAADAQRLVISFREMRTQLREWANSNDVTHLDRITSLHKEVRANIAACTEPDNSASEVEVLDEISAKHALFAEEFQRIKDDLPRPKALALVKEHFDPGLVPLSERFQELQQQDASDVGQYNQKTADRVGLGLVLLAVCGSITGLVLGYLISSRLGRSLVKLAIPMKATAGQLGTSIGPLELAASENIGDLETLMTDMSAQVSTVLERLSKTQQDALRAEQLALVGQLAAGVAHEIRNPLMAVKLLVQSAVEKGPEGRIEGRALNLIHDEIKRQEQTIQLFLDFARPPKLEPRDVDVLEVAENAIALVKHRAEKQKITLTLECLVASAHTTGDPIQLRQVLLNLFYNAFDAIRRDGAVLIKIQHGQFFPDGSQSEQLGLQISVADTGPGLPEEWSDRAFRPFVSTKDTGLGLGLSICKRIVESHGGTIAAANRVPPPGAIFTIWLPIRTSA